MKERRRRRRTEGEGEEGETVTNALQSQRFPLPHYVLYTSNLCRLEVCIKEFRNKASATTQIPICFCFFSFCILADRLLSMTIWHKPIQGHLQGVTPENLSWAPSHKVAIRRKKMFFLDFSGEKNQTIWDFWGPRLFI